MPIRVLLEHSQRFCSLGTQIWRLNLGMLQEAEPKWKRRWTIVALCFVAFMLCNMDRVNMSIAILPMSQQFGWDSQTIGLVQSSFFWGYLLTQVAGESTKAWHMTVCCRRHSDRLGILSVISVM